MLVMKSRDNVRKFTKNLTIPLNKVEDGEKKNNGQWYVPEEVTKASKQDGIEQFN